MHRIIVQSLIGCSSGGSVTVLGDEAHHAAKVKRLTTGDAVEILDGAGHIATARLLASVKLGKQQGWSIELAISEIRSVPPMVPALTVRSAVPKGPRLETMIDQLSQIGVAAWGPVGSTRSVVDPRQGKLDRLERVCLEAIKQSGRAWAMRIEQSIPLISLPSGPSLIVADASGDPFDPVAATNTGGAGITLAVGPEGGWTAEELDRFRSQGAQVARFGPHVMRIETAAVAAAAIIMGHGSAAPDAPRVTGH